MSENDYDRITYGIPMAVARVLAEVNPGMVFIYVSGAGADSSGGGRIMWARVKGKAENAVLQLPFAGAYVFHPAFVEPLHGVRSKTPAYRIFYAVGKPLFRVVRFAFPFMF